MGDGRNRWAAGEDIDKTAMRTLPATPEATAWQGWGTALKPAFEPIVLARKPLAGTVAANVLAHGTGGLNIDGCRIAFRDQADEDEAKAKNRHGDFGTRHGGNAVYGDYSMLGRRGNYEPVGRWPANVVVDPVAAAMLDEQTGRLAAGNHPARRRGIGFTENGGGANCGTTGTRRSTGRGGASRFFYCAKASRTERDRGLRGRNPHPTIKPIRLMRWPVRLVTRPGGLVLDPFAGSGTTGIACVLEDRRFIGIEREAEYVTIANARLAHWSDQAHRPYAH
jgi:site-specific DNA-methyltransferase (adenine-specific)